MMIVFALDKVDLCLLGYTLLATTFPHGKVKERRCLIVIDKSDMPVRCEMHVRQGGILWKCYETKQG